MARRRERAAVEGQRGPELHRRGQREQHVRSPRRLHDRRIEEVGHREKDGRDCERRRNGEPAAQALQVCQSERALALLCRGALGAIGGEHQCPVASPFDRAHEGSVVGAGRIHLHSRALCREVHIRRANAGDPAKRILYARHAGRARHPRDNEVAPSDVAVLRLRRRRECSGSLAFRPYAHVAFLTRALAVRELEDIA